MDSLVRRVRLGAAWRLLCMLLVLQGAACRSTLHSVATQLDLNDVQLQQALSSSDPTWPRMLSDLTDAQFSAQYGLSDDERTRRELQKIVDQVVAQSHKPDINLTVRYLRGDKINAFITGAGYVYIHEGLVESAQSVHEVAAIIGHEIAHIDAGHMLRRTKAVMWTQLAALAVAALTKGETADSIIQIAAAYIPAAYSREHEREADILGAVYARRAGFDPARMNDFFRRTWAREQTLKLEIERALRAAESDTNRAALGYQTALAYYQANPNRWNYSNAQQAYQQWHAAQARFLQVRNQYIAFVQQSSPLFRSHPVDTERMQTVAVVSDYANGYRPLASFGSSSKIFRTLSVLTDVENRERASPFFEAARASLAAPDREEATLLLHRSVQEDPKYADAWILLGKLELESGETMMAIGSLERARSLAPREFRADRELGLAHSRLGQPIPAAEAFERAIKHDPESLVLRWAAGEMWLQAGEPKRALKHLKTGRDRASDPGERAALLVGIAECYEELGKRRDAVESLEEALAFDPALESAHAMLRRLNNP